jgi:hypothetical protein
MSEEVMSPGFPNSSQFSAEKVLEYKAYWNWHRDHDTGGANYGQDMSTPDDSVLVGYIINIESEHHTKGAPDIYMLKKPDSVFQMPNGVHVGQRLEPEDFFGAGAAFKGAYSEVVGGINLSLMNEGK